MFFFYSVSQNFLSSARISAEIIESQHQDSDYEFQEQGQNQD